MSFFQQLLNQITISHQQSKSDWKNNFKHSVYIPNGNINWDRLYDHLMDAIMDKQDKAYQEILEEVSGRKEIDIIKIGGFGTVIGNKMEDGLKEFEAGLGIGAQEDNGGIVENAQFRVESYQQHYYQQYNAHPQLTNINPYNQILQLQQPQQFQNPTPTNFDKILHSQISNSPHFHPSHPSDHYPHHSSHNHNHNHHHYRSNNNNYNDNANIIEQSIHREIVVTRMDGVAIDLAQMGREMGLQPFQAVVPQIANFSSGEQIFVQENIVNIRIQDDNPEFYYKKQYKTRDINHKKQTILPQISPSRSKNVNNLSQLKKQLQNLQAQPQPTPSPSKKSLLSNNKSKLETLQNQNQPSVQLDYQKNSSIISPHSRTNTNTNPKTDKNSKIYKIAKQSVRKHSLKKQKQAQNQMLANIQFLHSIRGSASVRKDKDGKEEAIGMGSEGKKIRKQWKQDGKYVRDSLQQIKEARRKQMEILGFTQGRNGYQGKLGLSGDLSGSSGPNSPGLTQPLSPQYSDLPLVNEHKKSPHQKTKKGHIFKPAPFTVYSIQKTDQIFYNKLIN